MTHLKGYLVKVESVTHVIVCGDSLGVVVDHDGAVTQLAQRPNALHRTPVKLHRRPDAVHA